jgi:hypothetical protein
VGLVGGGVCHCQLTALNDEIRQLTALNDEIRQLTALHDEIRQALLTACL